MPRSERLPFISATTSRWFFGINGCDESLASLLLTGWTRICFSALAPLAAFSSRVEWSLSTHNLQEKLKICNLVQPPLVVSIFPRRPLFSMEADFFVFLRKEKGFLVASHQRLSSGTHFFLIFSLAGTDVARNRVTGMLFKIFERSYPPHKIKPP